MRHLITLLVTLFGTAVLAGCGGGGTPILNSIVPTYSIESRDGTTFERIQANGLRQRGAVASGLNRVGHDDAGRRLRMVFTFEVPAELAGRDLQQAFLVLRQLSSSAGSPYDLFGDLIVERVDGGGAFGTDLVDLLGVLAAQPAFTDVAPGESFIDVTSFIDAAVQAGDTHVQFRARFQDDGGFTHANHYVSLSDGESGQPRILISYR